MSRALALAAVLLVCAAAPLQASSPGRLESTNWSRYFMVASPNASTVAFDGQLYTVAKNQTHIRVNSSSSLNQPCEIAIDAARDVSQGRLEVTPTDEEIFVVGVRSVDAGGELYKYTILRVDPRACVYASADVPEGNDSRGGYFMPRLVRHDEGTDVFFPSLRNCAPCRLDNAGLRSRATTPQIPRETGSPGIPFHVRYLRSANAFFYVYNSHNFSSSVETTTMRLLDKQDLSAKKERIVDFPVHAVSKQKRSNGYLGVCTKTYDDFMADISAYTEVRCERLNAAGNLETTNAVRVPIEPHSEPISSISYEFDDQGNSYLSYAEDTKLRLYVHDKDGKLVKGFDMGMVDARFQRYPEDRDPMEFDAYEYWDVNGFLLGDEYCIVTGQVATTYPKPLEQVRCIDVKKYVKH